MTVAAVILAGTAESALADAAGRASVRRVVESAWAGGAVPIVVVAEERDGRVAAALAGSPALLSEAPGDAPEIQHVAQGARLARDQVGDTDAVLVWPGRLVWADAETVTSLIERHGVSPDAVLQPTYDDEAGWPVLVPMDAVQAVSELPPAATPNPLLEALERAGVRSERVEVGDPGVVHGLETPIDALPEYAGPPAPTGGPPPDWGPSAADHRDEEPPLEGPALAPYVQAEVEGE